MKQKNDSSPSTGNKILPLEECLAKTRHDADGNIGPGVNVETHCLATFEVARQLLKYYSNFCTASLWDPPKDLLAPLLHDVGKVSPPFQQKIHRAFEPNFPNLVSPFGKYDENHCITSALTLICLGLEECLELDWLSWVAASHHGSFCPSSRQDVYDKFLGGQMWEALREELIKKLIKKCGLELADISKEKKELILGLTILADWLSSGMDLEPGQEHTPEICAEAVRKAGFKPFKIQQGLTFSELFQTNDQSGFEPNDVQKVMLENIQPGGVYVLETEMGSGKTEAALALAYELLKSHRHAGIYFALPTQLTSEKIFERFEPFLEHILAPENGDLKPLLLHSKAWLEKEIQNDEENGFQRKEYKADSWFSDRKRALLAPFAVGTIDQLLMAVINVRHSALRSLGAAGKVIILDEVHSYDAYTGSLIRTLVKFLRKWNCTVIILSATLTKKDRDEFLDIRDNIKIENKELEKEYPLLSIRGNSGIFYRKIDQSKMKPKRIKISQDNSRDNAFDTALKHARRGECVLWIENTVGDAQEAFRRLASREKEDVEIGLIHSRFQEITRRKNENEWVDKFGKNSSQADRAGGKILVGTQVLEQSVDIDADFLVTRLCPTDMLLQRIGRLWRHESLNKFRPVEAHREVLILNETPFQNKDKWSEHETPPLVYDPYVLMRSQKVFENRDEIVIPQDMRELIESTYSEPEEKETGWYAHLEEELKKERERLKNLADLSTGSANQAQPDTEASTRYSEKETVEVLLLKEKISDNLVIPFDPDNPTKEIKIPSKSTSKEERIECAKDLSQYLVRVYADNAPSYVGYPLDNLSHILYTGTNNDRPLRAAIVGDGDLLLDQSCNSAKPDPPSNGKPISIKNLRYNHKIGYSYERKEDK